MAFAGPTAISMLNTRPLALAAAAEGKMRCRSCQKVASSVYSASS
jgi:hypothetical protein